ncbi:MAG TPA: IPT/TIG domain-containing protein, partial [Bacteroidota bacterium]|nr:IPT/TIG domain-containing protein [Bacteroidota bacterium]
MKRTFIVTLASFVCLMMIRGCNCSTPTIVSISPTSGPGGTIVEVVFSQGGLGGVVLWDGSPLSTRNGNSLGLSGTLHFTVPVGAPTGAHKVSVQSGSLVSSQVNFSVTGAGANVVPGIQGFDVAEGIKELTLYGDNFTTNSIVVVDADTVTQYSGSSQPFRPIPLSLAGNVLLCTLPHALSPGSAHTAKVVNAPGFASGLFAFTVPIRKTTFEYTAISGVPLPDYYTNRNGSVYSVRRSYTEAGMMLDIIAKNTDVAKPATGGIGGGFTDADLYSFWRAFADTTQTGWYMLALFADQYNDSAGVTTWGSMFMNVGTISGLPGGRERRGFALFRNSFTAATFGMQIEQAYNRDVLHESGHAF